MKRIGLAVLAGIAVALILWLIARLATHARERKERSGFLKVKLQCKGGCKNSWQLRNSFFAMNVIEEGESNIPAYVCAIATKE
jgi:hypothetical protein